MPSEITLNNGLEAPMVGLGLWKLPKETAAEQVYDAIKMGYRLFDGAVDYGNEVEVGKGIRHTIDEGLVKCEELFIVSKLWNTFHHPIKVNIGLDKTLADLNLGYIDLYYIHFPIAQSFVPVETLYPSNFGLTKKFVFEDVPIIETYRALEVAHSEGKIKAIGISKFSCALVQNLLRGAKIKPSALQILTYSSSGPQSFFELDDPKAKNLCSLFEHEAITCITKGHGKKPSQVLLRWATQPGLGVIPESSNKDRLFENLNVENFDLTQEELDRIPFLDGGIRLNDPWHWGNAGIPTLI